MKNKFKDFFIEDDLKIILGWLGINFKKAMKNRIKNSVFLFVLFLIIGIVFKNIYISLSSILISIVYYKIQYLLLKNEKKKVIALKRRMFPSMVKKLLILLRTNNTYISLNKLLDFTDNPIKKYLIEMIQEIDLDKSVKPYLNFAKKWNLLKHIK